MTDLRAAAEKALEALEYHFDNDSDSQYAHVGNAKNILRHALAQPKQDQEPEIVRSVRTYTGKRRRDVSNPCISANECIELANWIDSKLNAPPSKLWVSLTDEEIWENQGLDDLVWGRNIEAALKERNT